MVQARKNKGGPAPSDALSESDLSGNINAEYIFFNGMRVARVDRPSLVVHHFLTDHLSSSRMSWTGTTDANRAIEQDIDYTPYGITVGAAPVDHYEFTGKERDSESGADYFDARHYTSIMGRFLQPDPAGLAAADPSNPQSWNRYAYALNNPLSFIDPSGMLLCDYGGEDFEDADDDKDCTDHGGTPATDQTTITVSADNPDDVVTTENGHQIFSANDASNRLNNLLNQLKNCPQAAGMAKSLMQMQASGKLVLANLAGADGSTSLTGTISIDSTYGINAHNVAHEYFHTIQMSMFMSVGQTGAGASGFPSAGPFLGVAAWVGARDYNAVASIFNNTPGFGPLDAQAEAFGQQVSSQCGTD